MTKMASTIEKNVKISKTPAMIQNDIRLVREGSGSFPGHQSSIKKVTFLRLDNVLKTPTRSHMNPQNHAKIHKYLVLAHNIHKDCPLGVVGRFIDDTWCEALSFSMVHEGPKGDF